MEKVGISYGISAIRQISAFLCLKVSLEHDQVWMSCGNIATFHMDPQLNALERSFLSNKNCDRCVS